MLDAMKLKDTVIVMRDEKVKMTRKEIEQEFKKIDYELRVNKPDSAPYPLDIVKRREFLLFAQVHLSNILDAKLKRDEWDEKFETEMYNKVKEIYYNWNKNGGGEIL